MVHRVVFEGKRAVGVEFARGGAKRTRHGRARGDPVGGRGRLAAYPAALRRRRCRASGRHRRAGRARAERRRAQHAGSFPGAHFPSGCRTANGERKIARHPAGDGGAALAGDRQGHPELQPVAGRGLGEGAGVLGDVRHADHLRARQLQERADRRAGGHPRRQRRRLADAAAVAWLCEGDVEPAARICR